jgi:hypothetical protein
MNPEVTLWAFRHAGKREAEGAAQCEIDSITASQLDCVRGCFPSASRPDDPH